MISTIELAYGSIAMLLFGASTAIAKASLRKVDPVEVAFHVGLVNTVFYIGLIAFMAKTVTIPTDVIRPTVLVAALGYLPLLFLYKALAVEKMGLVSPITNSSVMITVLLSAFFFGEEINGTQVASMIALVAGLFMISYDSSEGGLRFSKGVRYALVACVLWGVVFSFVIIPNKSIGPVMTAFLIEFGVFVGASIQRTSQRFRSKEPLVALEGRDMLYLIIVALSAALAFLSFNAGTAVKFRTSFVAAVAFSYPVIVVLWGRIFYKEKLTRRQCIAIAIILASIFCLRLGQ